MYLIGNCGHLRKMVSERTCYRICSFVRRFPGRFKGFALDWVVSGSGGNSVIGDFNNSYLDEGRLDRG